MSAASNVIHFSLLYMRPLQWWLKTKGFFPRGNPLRMIKVVTLAMDASLTGWGVDLSNHPACSICGGWGWMLWYRLGRGFVCTPFPDCSAHRSFRESAPGWGPSIAKTLFWLGREWFSDMISLLDGSPWGIPVRRNLLSLAKVFDLSPLLGVVEAVGVRLRVQRPSA